MSEENKPQESTIMSKEFGALRQAHQDLSKNVSEGFKAVATQFEKLEKSTKDREESILHLIEKLDQKYDEKIDGAKRQKNNFILGACGIAAGLGSTVVIVIGALVGLVTTPLYLADRTTHQEIIKQEQYFHEHTEDGHPDTVIAKIEYVNQAIDNLKNRLDKHESSFAHPEMAKEFASFEAETKAMLREIETQFDMSAFSQNSARSYLWNYLQLTRKEAGLEACKGEMVPLIFDN